jgi:hypothetical protein
VDVPAVVQRVHLVHSHALELIGMSLEDVDQPDWLAVRQRDDHVGAPADMPQNFLGRLGPLHQSRHDRGGCQSGGRAS